jgi:hypothetical protein
MRVSRNYVFVAAIVAAFIGPMAVPGFGVNFTYLFIVALVFFAWFSIKWGDIKAQTQRGGLWEASLGLAIIVALYAYKLEVQTRLGLLDMMILFSALVLSFYGVRSFRLF